MISCSGSKAKILNQPDMVIQSDGDYLAGCSHGIQRFSSYYLHFSPSRSNVDAACIELYLEWLEKGEHNGQ